MSLKAVDEFRECLSSDPTLQAKMAKAFKSGLPAVVALGADNGFTFTPQEAQESLARYDQDGELTDYEMELVSAGGTVTPTASMS